MSEKILDKILNKLFEMDEKIDLCATKIELRQFKNEVMTHFDYFAKLYNRLDIEILANRSRSERLEVRVDKIESKLGLET